jgi:hypothetical protein
MLAGHKAFLDKKYELEKKAALEGKLADKRDEARIRQRVADDKRQKQLLRQPQPTEPDETDSDKPADASFLLDRKRLHEQRWRENHAAAVAPAPGAQTGADEAAADDDLGTSPHSP